VDARYRPGAVDEHFQWLVLFLDTLRQCLLLRQGIAVQHRHPLWLLWGDLFEETTDQGLNGFLACACLPAGFNPAGFMIDLHQRLDIQQAADESCSAADPPATVQVF
jgi:hypothetical protein